MKRLVGVLGLAALFLAGCAAPETLAFRLNEQGIAAYHAGGYAEALELFRQAQVARPDYPELNVNAGSALHKAGEYERAARELQRALSTDDARLRARTHFNLGNNFYRMGHMQGAIEEYKWALRSDPDDADAKHNLEFVLLQMQDYPHQGPQPDAPSGGQNQQGDPNDDNQQDGEPRERENGQPNPASGAQQPPNQNNSSSQEAPNEALSKMLQEAGPDLGIEDAIRILDVLRERERAIQAQWNRGNGRVPPAERDW